jgi:translocator protein
MIWICFVIFLAACFAAGATGGLFPPGRWYDGLNKPSWTPPNWLFPVAWTTLYFCMAAAGARVAVADGNAIAMALWSLQIALNTLWTPVFFGLRRMRLGLLVLASLWLSVAATMVALWSVDWIAGLLFVPYLVWVSVAAALNRAVIQLNPEEAMRERQAAGD